MVVQYQELLESQMHKMQLENSTLKTENKLLKDKYNRATGTAVSCHVKLGFRTSLLYYVTYISILEY